jgi:hypothetical protein
LEVLGRAAGQLFRLRTVEAQGRRMKSSSQ